MKALNAIALALLFAAPARAEEGDRPSLAEICGTWKVSRFGMDSESKMLIQLNWTQQWVIRQANGKISVSIYNVSTDGFVGDSAMKIDFSSYENGQLRLGTSMTSYGVISSNIVYEIDFANAKSASGGLTETTSSSADQMMGQLLGAPSSSFETKIATPISLTRESRNTARPKNRPTASPAATATPPAPTYNSFPMYPPSYSAPYFVPVPPSSTGPRPFNDMPKNTSHCATSRMTCMWGCDPPNYGRTPDFAARDRCEAACESNYQRCIR